jgi:predicted SnoaL-like aldol condensation-catalyzing enzyme
MAVAAGAVEMQVERIVNTAIDEYNAAMDAGEPEAWLKYFTDNVRRTSPLGAQQGRAAFTEYYQSEFKNFKAHWNTKKMIVMGRSAAAIVECEMAQKPSGAEAKVDMAVVFELASSGRFESIDFYFDPAKIAKLVAAAK